MNVFGMRGYLSVMDSAAEFSNLGGYDLFWLGIERIGGTWKVISGPRKGQNAPYINWDSANGQPNGSLYEVALGVRNHLFHDYIKADPVMAMCEFGGWRIEHPNGKNARGATRLAVLATACEYGARAQWAYPGPCSQQTYTAQYGRINELKALFSDAAMPDVATLSSDPVATVEFELTISPAMCHTPSVELSNGVSAPTLTPSAVTLNGVTAPIGTYWTVVKTIAVRHCNSNADYPMEKMYDMLWTFKPVGYASHNGAYGEPHYYKYNSGPNLAANDASVACGELWGMQGYLATLTSSTETSAVYAITASSFWSGGEGWGPGQWLWRDGPERGQSVLATQWSGQWYTGEPANNGQYRALEANWNARFHAGDSAAALHYVCEYGGTEGSRAFRGAIRLTMSQVACNVPDSRRYYDFPGVCHVAFDAQLPGATKARTLFTHDVVPDLMPWDTMNVRSFTVRPSDVPLCTPLSVAQGPLSLANDVNSLMLSNVASVATYHSVLQTITFTTCPRDGDVTDEFTFVWAYEPDATSYASPTNGEPHYYVPYSTYATFGNSMALCGSMFGLQGYLASVTSQGEQDVVNGMGYWGFLGMANVFRHLHYYWVQGPDTYTTSRPFSRFDTIPTNEPNGPQSDATGVFAVAMRRNGVNSWSGVTDGAWEDTNAAALPYLCEYGGSAFGMKAFRGITRIDVRTSPCDFSLHENSHLWGAKGPCYIQHTVQGLDESRGEQVLFPQQLLDDEVLASSSFGVTGYGVEIADKDMCGKFTTTSALPAGTTLDDTVRHFKVAHSPSTTFAVAKAVLATLRYSTCSRAVATIESYDVMWWVTPDITTARDPVTNEPLFFHNDGVARTWHDSVAACEAFSPFGLVSYMAQPVNDVVHSVVQSQSATPNVLLIGLSDFRHLFGHIWYGGPRAGTFAIEYSKWGALEPSHCQGCEASWGMQQCALHEYASSQWDDVQNLGFFHVLCQAGGLPVRTNAAGYIHGIIHIKVQSTECASSAFVSDLSSALTTATYGFKGTCHVIDDVYQPNDGTTTTTRTLFDTDAVPDLMASDATSASSFTATVYPALCTPLTANVGSSGLAVSTSTTTTLTLSNVASVATYVGVIRTIIMTTCARSRTMTDAFYVKWEYMPHDDGSGSVFKASAVNPATAETHYYRLLSPHMYTAAARACAELTLFGLKGYLANSVDATENAVLTALTTGDRWVGMADFARRRYIKVVTGPELGRAVKASTYEAWVPPEPNFFNQNEILVTMFDAGWNDITPFVTFPAVCEFGGTMEGARMFRGTTLVKVRSTPCGTFGGVARSYQGTCHELPPVMQTMSTGTTPTQTRTVFSATHLADVVTTDAVYSVRQLTVTVAPSLCTALSIVPSGGVAVAGPTVSGVTVTGSGVLGTYVSILRSIQMTTCTRAAATSPSSPDTYAFDWELVPDVVQYSGGTDPHYYHFVRAAASGVIQSAAILECAARTLFGLKGYAATITTSYTLVQTHVGSAVVWLGASDSAAEGTYRWVVGPERGLDFATSGYAAWDGTEPTGSTAENGVVSNTGAWYDVSDNTATTYGTLCEFGGMYHTPPLGSATYRGRTFVHVHTLAYDVRGLNGYTYVGAHDTLEFDQPARYPRSRHIFTPDVVPTMLASDATHQASSFSADVSPALCTPLTASVGLSGLAVSTSTTTFTLSNSASVATYHGVLQTVLLTGCHRHDGILRNMYSIVWQLQPALSTLSDAAWNNEPHYYALFTAVAPWYTAKANCESSRVFGLPGYFVSVTSGDENELVKNLCQSTYVWLGHSWDGLGYRAWTWQSGPSIDLGSISYAHWRAGEPNGGIGGENSVEMTCATSEWNDVPPTNNNPYVCEYGGTGLASGVTTHFRGVLDVTVKTVTGSATPSATTYQSMSDTVSATGTVPASRTTTFSESHAVSQTTTDTLAPSPTNTETQGATILPPRITLGPVIIVPSVPTLGPEHYTANPAGGGDGGDTSGRASSPSTSSSGGGAVQSMNAFLLGSSSGMSPVLFFLAFAVLMVSITSFAMYRACRAKPSAAPRFADADCAVAPRTKWPRRYKHADVLCVLFPDAVSQPVPDCAVHRHGLDGGHYDYGDYDDGSVRTSGGSSHDVMV